VQFVPCSVSVLAITFNARALSQRYARSLRHALGEGCMVALASIATSRRCIARDRPPLASYPPKIGSCTRAVSCLWSFGTPNWGRTLGLCEPYSTRLVGGFL
jgi:hypothetical protein